MAKRDYTDKDGIKRYVTEVVADRFNGIILLDGRDGAGDSSSYQSNSEPEADRIDSDSDNDLPF